MIKSETLDVLNWMLLDSRNCPEANDRILKMMNIWMPILIEHVRRLQEYASADTRCPCCGEDDGCFYECAFSSDCPDEMERMKAAREALGPEV